MSPLRAWTGSHLLHERTITLLLLLLWGMRVSSCWTIRQATSSATENFHRRHRFTNVIIVPPCIDRSPFLAAPTIRATATTPLRHCVLIINHAVPASMHSSVAAASHSRRLCQSCHGHVSPRLSFNGRALRHILAGYV